MNDPLSSFDQFIHNLASKTNIDMLELYNLER